MLLFVLLKKTTMPPALAYEPVMREAAPFIGDDDRVPIKNPHLNLDEQDMYLYHLKLNTEIAQQWFGNAKFVLMGGSADRAYKTAQQLHEQLGLPIEELTIKPSVSEGLEKGDLSEVKRYAKGKVKAQIGMPTEIGGTERFSMYKVGPVVVINHGMGLGSIEILMHEIILLLHAAGAKGTQLFRVGTSGGYGEEPGTTVITDRAWSDRPDEDAAIDGAYFPKTVNGKIEYWPSEADPELIAALVDVAERIGATVKVGDTMSKSTFYGSESRMDGAICDLDHSEAEEFHERCRDEFGIINSEMEAGEFLAITRRLGIRSAIVCAVLDNCLTHQSIDFTKEQLAEFSRRAEQIVIHYIAEQLGITPTAGVKSWTKSVVQSLVR